MTGQSPALMPQRRQYSAALTAKILSAQQLSAWLLEHQPSETMATDRNRIAGAFFNIALDHHVALVFLMSHQMVSPAFSLARSVWEAYVRGLWARELASDNELRKFIAGQGDPKMVSIVKAIKDHPDLDNENKIAKLHDQAWTALNSYGHGGSLQIQRWITAESVEAAHTDDEVADLLRFANHVAFRACVALVELAEADHMGELFVRKGNELASADWF
jgi:hypothetical protein